MDSAKNKNFGTKNKNSKNKKTIHFKIQVMFGCLH